MLRNLGVQTYGCFLLATDVTREYIIFLIDRISHPVLEVLITRDHT